METINYLSEHQVVLTQQRETVYEIEHIVGKFNKMIYTLETTDELLGALLIKLEKINACLAEFHRIDSQIDSDYQDAIQKMNLSLENNVGIVERDEGGNLHCGKCLLPYKYCQEMVGKKVKLSLITLNVHVGTRNMYPIFAKHVDVVD